MTVMIFCGVLELIPDVVIRIVEPNAAMGLKHPECKYCAGNASSH